MTGSPLLIHLTVKISWQGPPAPGALSCCFVLLGAGGGGCSGKLPGLKFQQAGDTPSPPCSQAASRIFPVNTPTTHGPAHTSPALLPHPPPPPPGCLFWSCRCRPKSFLTTKRRRARCALENICNCISHLSSDPQVGALFLHAQA